MTITKTRIMCFVCLLALVLFAGLLARPAEAQQVQVADLSVQKFDFPPDQVSVGETLYYELAVANLGPDTATGAVVTDTLPSNTEFLFTFSGDCTNAGQTVTCDLGDLAPNEQTSVEFAVCPRAPGTATNTATVSSSTTDPNPANDTATETTRVTTPAVGKCPSQKPSPPTENPQPNPTPPAGNPQPEPPKPPTPVANTGLCFTMGAVAVQTLDFSIACAGGQAIASEGDGSDGILAGGKPANQGSSGGAIAEDSGSRAISGNGGAFAQE